MGQAEELARIAKKLDKMVSRKNLVRSPALSVLGFKLCSLGVCAEEKKREKLQAGPGGEGGSGCFVA